MLSSGTRGSKSSGRRGGKLILYLLTTFQFGIACFIWKPEHFEFQSYDGAWHKDADAFVEKYLLISWFLPMQKLKYYEICLCKCLFDQYRCLINRLDNQTKFETFTPFFGRHVRKYSNMAAPYWALAVKLCKITILSNIWKLRKRTDLKLGEVSSISVS